MSWFKSYKWSRTDADAFDLLGNVTLGLSIFPLVELSICHYFNVRDINKMSQMQDCNFNIADARKYIARIKSGNHAVTFGLIAGLTSATVGIASKIIAANISSRVNKIE